MSKPDSEVTHVVVSCTNSKTLPVPDALRFRNIKGGDPDSAFDQWSKALQDSPSPETPAWKLYKGDHWVVVRDIMGLGKVRPIRVWVCSAGYGLVDPAQSLKPYAITFSPSQEDSISSDDGQNQKWWHRLTQWTPTGSEAPRSFESAMSQHSQDRWIAVLSSPYLSAVRQDLSQGRQQLKSPQQLSIISAGAGRLNGLSDAMLPADERLQTLLSGAKLSLNVRIARWLLQEAESLDHEALDLLISSTLAGLDRPARPDRHPLSDAEIVDFIKTSSVKYSKPSHTRLLRRLRDEGKACEQSRFARLFALVRDELANA